MSKYQTPYQALGEERIRALCDAFYDVMDQAYVNIFDRFGLDYRAVSADSGAIGGSTSQEFHVLADSGEDAIAFSDQGSFAANIETVEALPPSQERAEAGAEIADLAIRPLDDLAAAPFEERAEEHKKKNEVALLRAEAELRDVEMARARAESRAPPLPPLGG